MTQMSKDWNERLEKAKSNEDFINLLNEVPLSKSYSLTERVGQESSTTEPTPILRPLTLTTKDD